MFEDSRHGKLFKFLHYQRLMGLAYIDYSSVIRGYVLNPTRACYMLQLLVLLTLSYCLYGVLDKQCVDSVSMGSPSLQIFCQLVLLTSPITQYFVIFWMHLQEQKQLILVQKLCNLAHLLQVETSILTRPNWLYRFWWITTIYYILHFLHDSISFWQHCPHIVGTMYSVTFYINLVRNNFIITCYTSLVSVIMSMLQEQASQLIRTGSTIDCTTLAKNFRIHDEFVLICMEELMEVFGVILLINFLYIGTNAVYVAYLTTLDNQFSSREMVTIYIWMLLLFVYTSIPLMNNELIKGVSVI